MKDKKIEYLCKVLGINISSLKKGSGKIILISGGSCSGKSLIAGKIAEKYPDFEILNAGEIFRKKAKKLEIPLPEFMKSGKDASDNLINLDKAVDKKILKHIIESDNNIILTSRFGAVWGYILDSIDRSSFSIYLNVSKVEKKKRFTLREFKKDPADLSQSEKAIQTAEEKRDSNDASRYEMIYGLNPNDFSRHARIIDTTDLSADKLCKLVLSYVDDFVE